MEERQSQNQKKHNVDIPVVVSNEFVKMKPNMVHHDTETPESLKDHNNIKKRSSKGCLTCKLRKKRCDEVKPICGDCLRLNRKCAYITADMSAEEIRKLKEEMMLIEKDSKARKRKKKISEDNSDSCDNEDDQCKKHPTDNNPVKKRKSKHNNKVVFNPLAMNMATMANPVVFQSFTAPIKPTLKSSKLKNPKVTEVSSSTYSTIQPLTSQDEVSRTLNSFLEKGMNNNNNNNLTTTTTTTTNNNNNNNNKTIAQIGNNYNNNDNNQANCVYKPASTQLTPLLSSFSPPLDLQNITLPIPPDLNTNPISNNPNNNQNTLTGSTHNYASISDPTKLKSRSNSLIPPLSLNGEEHATSFTDLFSTGFPKLLQDYFKSETAFTFPTSASDQHSLSQIHDAFKLSPRFQPSQLYNDMISPIPPNNTSMDMYSPSLNNFNNFILNNTINATDNYYDGNNSHHNHNNATNNNNNNGNNNNSNNNYHALIKSKQSTQIYMNPSVVSNSTLAHLSPLGKTLYEYYRDKLSFIVCSAPKTENMYLNTFLPMAHIDKSVLYGILAWSAFHLGMEKQGNYYIKLALKGFSKRPILDEEVEGQLSLIGDDVNDDDEEIIKELEMKDEGEEIYEALELSRLNKDNMINMRLAAFLILCGVEICKGDVSKWSNYLTYGAKLIKLKGGLEKFNASKDEHFLVTNYAYHDITAIQVINERTIHFDLKEYEKMWSKSNELGFSDPLHGISSPVFQILAEINKLVIVVEKLMKRAMKDDSECGDENNKSRNEDYKINLGKNVAESPEEGKVYGLEEEDYWINGDFDRSSIGSSLIDDDKFMKGVPSTVSDEWADEDHDKEVVLEDFDYIMVEVQKLEEKIANVKPKISPGVSNKDLELQLTVFECFQITARIHLRQSVLRMNSASLEIQFLETQLFKLLDVLLGTDVEACLCLPMFIAGMNCVRKKDRLDMTNRFKAFIERYKWKNVLRCQIVIRYIWKLNYKGLKFVDWYAVVKALGWDLSFA